MLTEVVIVGVAVVITTVIFLRDRRNKNAICQPYGLLGFVKKYLAWWYLKWLGSKPKLLSNHDPGSMSPHKTGVIPSEIEDTVEHARKLPDQPHMVDGVSFMGTDAKGNLLVVRLDRRKDGRAEVWLYMRTCDGQEYQLPCHPDTRAWQMDRKNSFSVGGLRIEPLAAMRRWRVTFNGLLRKGTRKDCGDKQQNAVHVRFNFLWVPLLPPYDFNHDVNYEMLSSAIAAQSWGLGFFDDFDFYDTDCYEQWGELMGTLRLGDEEEEELILRGPRRRTFGLSDWSLVEQYANFHLVMEDGDAIYISAENKTEGLRRKLDGYIICSNSMCYQMHFCDFTWTKFAELIDGSKNSLIISFKAGKKSYTLGITCDKSECMIYAGEKWSVHARLIPVKILMGGKRGQGILETGLAHQYKDVIPKTMEPPPYLCEIDGGQADASVYAVSFTDLACHQSLVVGGKALSLALLDKMTKNQFIVPTGICVAVSAFWKQIRKNPKLRDAIHTLQDTAWKRRDGDLIIECERVVDLIANTTVDEEIFSQLRDKSIEVFGKDFANCRLAVRSSAIGEDSEDTSAAGQNATYLGVQGLDELKRALAKCWASQFSYQSVEYKRQHGQLINGGMGVVIQEMVPAEVAGVMFTRDPVTGNPEFITITANYGLGESVVSATAEPDTITIKRTWDNQLSIDNKVIGKKHLKIVMKENGGVEENTLDEWEKSQCCMSDDQIMKLAEIAKQVELAFGTPRDIEWAISGDRIYLLQSRPITSLNSETEYETEHGLDSGALTDSEYFTRGNTGEVLPGAMSPLTLSVICSTTDIALQRKYLLNNYDFTMNPYCLRSLASNHSHILISLVETLQGGLFDEDYVNPIVKAVEISIIGRSFVDERFHKTSYERYGKPPWFHSLKRMVVLFKSLFLTGKSSVDHAKVSHERWILRTQKLTSSLQVYNRINETLPELFCVVSDHLSASEASTSWNLIVFSTLTNNSAEDWTVDQLSDLSVLLGNCPDVISADVPSSIKTMSEIVKRDVQSAEFSRMSPKDAKKWLETHRGESGDAYEDFLELHAHRCVKEFDLRSVPWGDNPENIISAIQKLVSVDSNPADVKIVNSVSDAIAKVRTPMSRIGKLVMSFVLPRSRNAVAHRELTKSICVKVINEFRKAYHLLATLMVHEGRIPDEDLIFFLTHHEIGQLIRTRSARLISRAIRRRQVYPKLDALKFPEISVGVPRPIIPMKYDNNNLDSNCQVKATPVSPGCIQGTARVLVDVNETKQIQSGDILITYSTDIGWSPYFPMLSGVVTEIGGIISHGAVVAREYGLPCLVGATGATSIFKSGDSVLLDANKGTLTKIMQ